MLTQFYCAVYVAQLNKVAIAMLDIAPTVVYLYSREELQRILAAEPVLSLWKPVYQMGMERFPASL